MYTYFSLMIYVMIYLMMECLNYKFNTKINYYTLSLPPSLHIYISMVLSLVVLACTLSYPFGGPSVSIVLSIWWS